MLGKPVFSLKRLIASLTVAQFITLHPLETGLEGNEVVTKWEKLASTRALLGWRPSLLVSQKIVL